MNPRGRSGHRNDSRRYRGESVARSILADRWRSRRSRSRTTRALRESDVDHRRIRFLHDRAWTQLYRPESLGALPLVHSAPPQFATLEFFRLARSRLNEDGVLIANFYGSLAPESSGDDLFRAQTMRAAFPQVYVSPGQFPQRRRCREVNHLRRAHASNPDRRADCGRRGAGVRPPRCCVTLPPGTASA